MSNQVAPDGFSITLSHASPDAPWVPVAVVISKSEHRHRITFSKERPLEQVFCAELSGRLLEVLNGFNNAASNGVFTNPDEEIRLPGLALRQLRVLFTHHGNEPSRALVRFTGIVGNPHRALQGEDGFSFPLEALTSKVYRDALDWVLMPAVNIVSLDELSAFDDTNPIDVEASLNKLRASKEQLLFQIELVKRELTRLEKHSYSQQPKPRALLAAEPPQEDFRTMRAIKDMGR